MTDIHIPPEAVEKTLEAFAHASGLGIFPDDEKDEEWREDLVNGMTAAILAALDAVRCGASSPSTRRTPMLKPEQVPPDAMYAAWKAINAGMTLNDAIAAAINAWPGVGSAAIPHWPGPHQEIEQRPSIILPLTEPRDERD